MSAVGPTSGLIVNQTISKTIELLRYNGQRLEKMGSCHGAHSVPEKAALQGHCPAWALMIQAPTRVNLVVGRVARPAMRSQGFLAIGSGSARSHHQGSEECRHS